MDPPVMASWGGPNMKRRKGGYIHRKEDWKKTRREKGHTRLKKADTEMSVMQPSSTSFIPPFFFFHHKWCERKGRNEGSLRSVIIKTAVAIVNGAPQIECQRWVHCLKKKKEDEGHTGS